VAEGEITPNGRNRGGGLEMSNHQMGSFGKFTGDGNFYQ
jgi:hypothetical protein